MQLVANNVACVQCSPAFQNPFLVEGDKTQKTPFSFRLKIQWAERTRSGTCALKVHKVQVV